MILKMIFRNIFRYKKRTVLTLITMIVGIYLAILGEGLNSGLENQITDIYIKTDTSHYKIYGKDFYLEKDDNDQLEYPIENLEKIEKILKNKDYSKRLLFKGNITDGREELIAQFIGVESQKENLVFERDNYMVEGSFVDNENSLVIGLEMARLLDLGIGDEVTLIARTASQSINAYSLVITGIIKTGNTLMDSSSIFIDLDFAHRFADTPFVNDIAVKTLLTDEEVESLKKLQIDFIPWQEEIKDILRITSIRRKAFAIISMTILVMAGVTIANTMLMAMLERQKEIGIMMANGMNNREILLLFLGEGTFVGSLGSFIGFLFGAITTKYYQNNGIQIAIKSSDLGINIPFSDRLYLYFDLEKSLIIFIVGILFSAVASIYPAMKSIRLDPSEAIKDR
ncbi:FtsX-like permease family protein [uncultured Ilyobacter sp.]|uniref:ABC transporter permease n=1 Tax=uncultured Ilyobacter sp. TaxID=544433 RepID=UPI0029F54D7F|nr:FtsX-like permease family protein [uncultured Ilyobacter sp.]